MKTILEQEKRRDILAALVLMSVLSALLGALSGTIAYHIQRFAYFEQVSTVKKCDRPSGALVGGNSDE